jgi:hypothetical protein
MVVPDPQGTLNFDRTWQKSDSISDPIWKINLENSFTNRITPQIILGIGVWRMKTRECLERKGMEMDDSCRDCLAVEYCLSLLPYDSKGTPNKGFNTAKPNIPISQIQWNRSR